MGEHKRIGRSQERERGNKCWNAMKKDRRSKNGGGSGSERGEDRPAHQEHSDDWNEDRERGHLLICIIRSSMLILFFSHSHPFPRIPCPLLPTSQSPLVTKTDHEDELWWQRGLEKGQQEQGAYLPLAPVYLLTSSLHQLFASFLPPPPSFVSSTTGHQQPPPTNRLLQMSDAFVRRWKPS